MEWKKEGSNDNIVIEQTNSPKLLEGINNEETPSETLKRKKLDLQKNSVIEGVSYISVQV